MGSIIILIGIIAGPLILFSTLNPINRTNLVTGVKLELSITINGTDSNAVNEYTLFKTSQFSFLEQIPDGDFNSLHLENEILISTFERALVQEARFFNVSNSNWDITPPSQEILHSKLKDINNDTRNSIIQFRLTASFMREFPQDSQVVSSIFTKNMNNSNKGDKEIIQNLTNAANPNNECDNTSILIDVKELYMPVVFLSKSNEPTVLKSDKIKKNDVTISKNCKKVFNYTIPMNYWAISQKRLDYDDTDGNNGLYFITASEKVPPEYFVNYTIIGFYTAIVLVLYSFIKSITQSNTSNIFISNMQQPDVLLLLCEGVIIARMERDTIREKELYQRLIDIMRSPSMIKIMTPSTWKDNYY